MTETLSFPGLGLSFELSRVAFWIGEFPIYWYGITFALGFALGLLYFHFNSKKIGVHPYVGLDVILWAVLGGIVGARAYYVIFQWEALYKDNPLKIFAFREGGLAIYGGVIGAIIAGLIACRIKKIPLAPMLDVGLPALLLAQAIGRWGNFFNIEAFGCNTELPWGMTSKTIENYLSKPQVIEELAKLGQTANPYLPVHPTFFYEFAWNLIGFLFLAYFLTPRRRFDGQVALGYMGWYGLGRVFIEGLRTDSLVTNTPWGMIRVSQYLAGFLFVLSLVLMVVGYIRVKKNGKLLYVNTDESIEAMTKAEASIQSEKKKNKKDEPETTAVATMEQAEETSTEEMTEVAKTEEVNNFSATGVETVSVDDTTNPLEVPENIEDTTVAKEVDNQENLKDKDNNDK